MQIDSTELAEIEKLEVKAARVAAVELIISSKTSKMKKERLKRDLQAAPTTQEVVRILWMCVLSGEGMGSLDSNWNKI